MFDYPNVPRADGNPVTGLMPTCREMQFNLDRPQPAAQ